MDDMITLISQDTHLVVTLLLYYHMYVYMYIHIYISTYNLYTNHTRFP